MGPHATTTFLLSALATAYLLVCHAAAAFAAEADLGGQPVPVPRGYDHGFDTAAALRKRQKRQDNQQQIVVRGAPRGNGSTIPLRPEIRELEKDVDKWTLFILALDLMEWADQNEQLSWYQIAGIHGVPFLPWGGVPPTPGNEQSGYCTHESILFPTWHRPYLALYEQILYDHIQSIASWYTDGPTRERYQKAAADFRIPYWDWASRPPNDEPLLPPIIWGFTSVSIAGPNGVQNIANPLYKYTFNPINNTAFFIPPWDLWNSTMRSPTSGSGNAQSNNTLVSIALDNNQAAIQQRVYTLFSDYHNYTAFSNEAWYPRGADQSRYDSVESVHDTVHSLAGLGGHMTYIPFSSFDPLFWLHHANLDRLFALWQTVYPTSWITPQPARMGSFTTSPGEVVDGTTALTPFFADADGTFWTSDMVRSPEVFNYNYEDTVGSSFGAGRGTNDDGGDADATAVSAAAIRDDEARRKVKAAINRLYGESSPARLGYSLLPQDEREEKNKRKEKRPGEQTGRPRTNAWWSSTSPDPAPDTVLKGQTYREWTATISAPKQAFGGTYFIHLFSGEAPPAPSPELWTTSQNLVGTMSVFAAPDAYAHHHHHHHPDDMTGAASGENLVSGTIPLTSYLTSQVVAGILAGLDVDCVEPYLRGSLQLRVVLANGTAVEDASSVPGLRVGVVSAEVQAPSSQYELPKWGESVSHFNLI